MEGHLSKLVEDGKVVGPPLEADPLLHLHAIHTYVHIISQSLTYARVKKFETAINKYCKLVGGHNPNLGREYR